MEPRTVPVPSDLLSEGRQVLIALPWYRTASPLTTFSLLAMMDRSKYAITLNFGDAFIAHARNKIATQFVNSKMQWMWSADDDMIYPWGDPKWFNSHTKLNLPTKFAGLHALDRLMSHGKTLIGLTYFGRAEGFPPVFSEGPQLCDELLRNGPRDEIRPVKWIGTGGMLTHRSVFLDIETKFPHLSREQNNGVGQYYTSSEHDLHVAVDEVLRLCEAETGSFKEIADILTRAKHKAKIHSGLGMGEDVQMCVRATQAGHQPYVDLACWAGHVGGAVYPRISKSRRRF